MFDYSDFIHAQYVKMILTGEVFKVVFVDPYEPVLHIMDEDGDRRSCLATELEPMDCKRVAV